MYQRLLLTLALCGIAAIPALTLGQTQQLPNDMDRQFVQQAMQANLQEVTDGRAHQNSDNPSVRLFAQTMVRDHSAATAPLAALAGQLNLPYPKGNGLVQQTTNQTPGSEQDASQNSGTPSAAAPMDDRAYMQKQIGDHQQTIALFQNEMKNGGNTDLKAYAGHQLPILQNHLNMAQQFARGEAITPEPTPTPCPQGSSC